MDPGATQTSEGGRPAARVLAVVALVLGTIVFIVVIANSLGGSGSNSPTRTSGGGHKEPHHKYYVVEPGDTFGGIAAKEGVSVTRLERLNPNLDTQLLPEKGCVNLVPKGCKVLASGG
jgi:LysM domain